MLGYFSARRTQRRCARFTTFLPHRVFVSTRNKSLIMTPCRDATEADQSETSWSSTLVVGRCLPLYMHAQAVSDVSQSAQSFSCRGSTPCCVCRCGWSSPSIFESRTRCPQSSGRMREIVHIQAGQCGNQIGSKVCSFSSTYFDTVNTRGADKPRSGSARRFQTDKRRFVWKPVSSTAVKIRFRNVFY